MLTLQFGWGPLLLHCYIHLSLPGFAFRHPLVCGGPVNSVAIFVESIHPIALRSFFTMIGAGVIYRRSLVQSVVGLT